MIAQIRLELVKLASGPGRSPEHVIAHARELEAYVMEPIRQPWQEPANDAPAFTDGAETVGKRRRRRAALAKSDEV